MRGLKLTLAVLVSFICAGCASNRIPSAANSALDGPGRFTIYSLDPRTTMPANGASPTTAPDSFHYHYVLGKTEIIDPTVRRSLVEALRQSVNEIRDPMQAMCFNPRHGIRIKSGQRTIDFLICFECLGVIVFENDQPIGRFSAADSAEPAFSNALQNAHVPLPTN